MLRLKELRIERNLTQSDLASFLGLNQTAIGKYERSELEPNLQNLEKIADFFECSVDYLIGRSDDFGNVTVQSSGSNLTQEEKEILRLYRSINREFQHMAIGYLRKLGELEASQKIFQSPSRKESK